MFRPLTSVSSNDRASPGARRLKNPPANEGDVDLIPGLGRNPGGGNGTPLQYSRLEDPMDGGVWRATVHEMTALDTTEHLSVHTHTHLNITQPFRGKKEAQQN